MLQCSAASPAPQGENRQRSLHSRFQPEVIEEVRIAEHIEHGVFPASAKHFILRCGTIAGREIPADSCTDQQPAAQNEGDNVLRPGNLFVGGLFVGGLREGIDLGVFAFSFSGLRVDEKVTISAGERLPDGTVLRLLTIHGYGDRKVFRPIARPHIPHDVNDYLALAIFQVTLHQAQKPRNI